VPTNTFRKREKNIHLTFFQHVTYVHGGKGGIHDRVTFQQCNSYETNSVVAVTEGDTATSSRSSPTDRQQTCRFTFQSDIDNGDIVSATFGIYIRRASHSARSPYMATWVLVYALWPVAPDRPVERHLVHRRRIYLDDRDTGRWHHFSFLSQVRRWISNPHSNQGLLVQATDSRGEPLAVIQPNSDEEQPYVRSQLRTPESV